MNRRGFLKAILAAGVAPAVVGSDILMPLKLVQAVEWDIDWIPARDGLTFEELVRTTLDSRRDQLIRNIARTNVLLRNFHANARIS